MRGPILCVRAVIHSRTFAACQQSDVSRRAGLCRRLRAFSKMSAFIAESAGSRPSMAAGASFAGAVSLACDSALESSTSAALGVGDEPAMAALPAYLGVHGSVGRETTDVVGDGGSRGAQRCIGFAGTSIADGGSCVWLSSMLRTSDSLWGLRGSRV
jgi:hypothetical protein